MRRRLAKVPLVVQIGGCNDETSGYAHVQLPPTTWLEEAGLHASGNGRAVQWRNPVIKPRGACRPVLDIWADLARACGLEAGLASGDERGELLARSVADTALRANPLTRGISVVDLDPQVSPPGGILWPCTEPDDLEYEEDRFVRGDVRGRNILFRRNRPFPGTERRFPTADGKVSLAVATPSGIETARSSDHSNTEGGPLTMVATVAVDYISGWSGCAPTLSRPSVGIIVRIHPRMADEIGVRNGAMVIVKNEHGQFRGTAELSTAVTPDQVWCIETPGPSGQEIGPFGLFEVPEDGGARAAFTTVTVTDV